MKILAAILFLVNGMPQSVNGIWQMPDGNQFLIAEDKGKLNIALKVSPNCKQPLFLSMKGELIRRGGEIFIFAKSKKEPFPSDTDKCTVSFMLAVQGRIEHAPKRFVSKALMTSIIRCKKTGSRAVLDNISGTWKYVVQQTI